MKVVLPDPAIPTHTIATGCDGASAAGAAVVVEAICDGYEAVSGWARMGEKDCGYCIGEAWDGSKRMAVLAIADQLDQLHGGVAL